MHRFIITSFSFAASLVTSLSSAQPCSEVVNAVTVRFAGAEYRTIDREGVYFVDPAAHAGAPLPRPGDVNLAARIGSRVCHRPVRLALVDYVDCRNTSHNFEQSSQGQSRLLNLNGETFRVTGSPVGFDLFYFAYRVAADPAPGRAHLLVVETINDQERYTGVAITHPRVGAWAPPFQDEPLCPVSPNYSSCFGFCQEPDCFHPDVGVSAYTGQEYPLDGKPYNIHALFYPKMTSVKVTISSSGWYDNRNAQSGAAASRIWVYKFLDPLTDRLPAQSPPADPAQERRIGIYMPHPWYFYAHHGVPARTVQQRQQSLAIMLDTLRFCGLNWVEFNAINGSDRAGAAWYDSAYWHKNGANLLTELPPLAEARGIGLVPIITSMTIPDPPTTVLGFSFSDNSFQRRSDGEWVRMFNNRSPDPLRPEVQNWTLYFLNEIAVRVAGQPSVKGIGFRVNGKIGLCYNSHQDSTFGAKQSGYSTWNIQEFNRDTGSQVPTGIGQAYPWLRARPEMWERWIAYRCEKTRDFWLRARDLVRQHRPDWNLYVKIVLPSELPGTNIEWVNEGFDAITLLRHHGYDPAHFANEPGIVIERTMMVDQNRFYTRHRWGPPLGTNHWAYKDFHFQPILPQRVRTAAGAAVELYHNYWEEAFHPDWEFGTDLRTLTATGPGRSFYETITFSLRHGNVDTISLMGWERPILAHEHDLRSFAQAYRALPNVAPRDFDGTVEPDFPDVWVRWFGDRLAVLNDSGTARAITLRFPAFVPLNAEVVDVASGRVLIPRNQLPRLALTLELEPWSLRTLRWDYQGPAPTATPSPTGVAATATPTATATSALLAGNLLQNPSFEADGRDYVFPPMGWNGWGDDNPDGTVKAGQFGPDSLFYPHEGLFGVGKTTNWGVTTSAGCYQQVDVQAGKRYDCQVWIFTPTSGGTFSPTPGQMRLGVDPSGGTNRNAPSVQWTPWASSQAAWQRIGRTGSAAVVAVGARLTLFLEYRQLVARSWNGMYFDAASVKETPSDALWQAY